MKRGEVSEQEVAAVVVTHLEHLGADIYQEVECRTGIADIVAKISRELWIVEVKVSLSVQLLIQAMRRRSDAHRVIIAAPRSKTFREVGSICEELGIGLWEVRVWPPDQLDPGYGPRVREAVKSKRHQRSAALLASWLKPGHKTHAKAGSRDGGYYTEFVETCEQLARVVHAEPGITIRAAVAKIKHHYRNDKSAASALLHWIDHDKVKGVEARRTHDTHGPLVLHPVEAGG